MESRGFYVNKKDLNTIMEKFDKDKDGKISYSEFMDEFLPKSPSKVIWNMNIWFHKYLFIRFQVINIWRVFNSIY